MVESLEKRIISENPSILSSEHNSDHYPPVYGQIQTYLKAAPQKKYIITPDKEFSPVRNTHQRSTSRNAKLSLLGTNKKAQKTTKVSFIDQSSASNNPI